MNKEDRLEEANIERLLQTTLGGEARLSQRTRSRALENIMVRNRSRFQPREFPSLIVVCLALLMGFLTIFLTRSLCSGSSPMNVMYFEPVLFIFALNLIFIPVASVTIFLRRRHHETHV